MLLLGIDLGTSAIKVSIMSVDTGECIASARYPDTYENEIIALKTGWAEQSPEMWWTQIQHAIMKLSNCGKFNPKDVSAIGIAYQMHGLVIVDKQQSVLRDSIIWCDSRAVKIGEDAFEALGKEQTLTRHLNSPGNFTSSKLAWVMQHEPALFDKIYQVMLPGDYIAMKLTGEVTTTKSALSEGIFWDFVEGKLSDKILDHFGFDKGIFPNVHPLFSVHGLLRKEIAGQLGLKSGIPVSYKAGDQPNNALSLNVLNPGEVAATAGTSGVIYGISDQLKYDVHSRVNTFAHVNHREEQVRVGVLLCINGTGILNRWLRDLFGHGIDYNTMNALAQNVGPGSNGLSVLPFGNGAERMLNNKILGAQFKGLDLNIHRNAHLFRASQEGIAFAFRYGLDIMRENGLTPGVIRAGLSNMFLSNLFSQVFVDVTGVPVEFYSQDGSVGAAIGAGIGAGIFANEREPFDNMRPIKLLEPDTGNMYEDIYQDWLFKLNSELKMIDNIN